MFHGDHRLTCKRFITGDFFDVVRRNALVRRRQGQGAAAGRRGRLLGETEAVGGCRKEQLLFRFRFNITRLALQFLFL